MLYKREHRHMPARIVCHKSSYFDEGRAGRFLRGARQMGIDLVDLLSIRRSSARFSVRSRILFCEVLLWKSKMACIFSTLKEV